MGTTSFTYHSTRATVFTTMLPSDGRRIGGSSRMKSERSPGITRAARYPTVSSVLITTAAQMAVAPTPNPAIMPRITPN